MITYSLVMIAYININNFNENNLYFTDSIKNTVINNGKFIRLHYTNNSTIFNGIYIFAPLTLINKDNSNYINIKKDNYTNLLIDIEKKILNKYLTKKKKVFRLNDQISLNSIKIFNNNDYNDININKIIIKISGLWEDENSYGLTYKFINYN